MLEAQKNLRRSYQQMQKGLERIIKENVMSQEGEESSGLSEAEQKKFRDHLEAMRRVRSVSEFTELRKQQVNFFFAHCYDYSYFLLVTGT